MSLASEYPCAVKLVAHLEQLNLSLDALRVFHAMHHLIDNDPWSSIEKMGNGMNKVPKLLSRYVIQDAFPASVRDLRPLEPALQELEARGLLAEQRFLVGRRQFEMRFSRTAVELARRSKRGQFAMIDMDVLKGLSSPTQVLFYTRAIMHRRALRPIFQLPAFTKDQPWSAGRKRWIDAARKISLLFGDQYLFCPQLDMLSGEVVAMHVKIAHPKTQWSAGRLYSRMAQGRSIAIHGGLHYSLTREETAMRKSWTQVAAPRVLTRPIAGVGEDTRPEDIPF